MLLRKPLGVAQKVLIKAFFEHNYFECESEDRKIDQQEYAD